MKARTTGVPFAMAVVVWMISTASGDGQSSGARLGADPAAASWVVARRLVPGGAPGSSVIDLEQILPREIRPGQPFDYRLQVTNGADCPVAEVTVVQRLPESVTLVASYPQAEVKDGVATWRLGTMAVREARLIQARGVAADVGPLTFCCDTLYRAPLCVTVASTRPELLLSLDAGAEVGLCDAVPVQLTVRNTGTGQCRDVRLQYQLPEGMVGADGARQYTYRVGTLAAGEAKRAQAAVRALRTGVFQHQASAISADGPRSAAVAETRIVAPRLTLTQTGSEQQYAGRDVAYTFSLRNEGDMAARNVVVEDLLPAGAQVITIKPDAVQAANAERVVWRLASLPAGAGVDFVLSIRSAVAGTFSNSVTARADCAQDVTATHATQVKGIAAILLEVVDEDDPIEVGGKETYVITTTNQGSAACTSLVVKCSIEDYVEYISADGPTAASVTGREITFGPLETLAPKQKAVWRVVCGALKPGDVRFRVLLTSDQLSRPVEETESTRLY